MVYSNGDQYVGDYENSKINGFGAYTYSNSDKYEGEFLNDKFNG